MVLNKTYAICPVSATTINEKTARLNGGFTLLLLIIFAMTQNLIPVVFLASDFLLRSLQLSRYSLLTYLSKGISRLLLLDKKMINAGPKIFAARVGLIFSIGILIAGIAGLPSLSLSLAAILGLFSFLESALGICVACMIYPWLYRILYKINYTV
ncbi:MAG TPA: DUF4395 domain-containing protein [Bacteroidales bacterium]|nr:DUF4395 domain-containing protein [Bacteroidales bacterium]